jgi:hypothetical protein
MFIRFKCRKTGIERGRQPNRKVYNDAVVAVTLWPVKWEAFKQEMLNKLADNKDYYLSLVTDKGYSLSVAETAYSKVVNSLMTDRVAPSKFEPTALPNGQPVPNGYKYTGDGSGDPDAIYLSGIRIKEETLLEPPNGYKAKPTPKNAATVAQNIIKAGLGLEWRQYKVTPFYFSSIQLP